MRNSLFCFFSLVLMAAMPARAQTVDNIATKERTGKIISALAIPDTKKEYRVQVIVQSYLDTLAAIFKERKAAMAKANEMASVNKELAEARSQKAWNDAVGKFNKVHATFLGKLSSLITAAQVEIIKDAMTENGLQAEYKRFLRLLPDLSTQQKAQVKTYLAEAREQAMDAETEEMRKQWFIKYRGRANNYLAAAGFDLQKATADLERKNAMGSITPTIN